MFYRYNLNFDTSHADLMMQNWTIMNTYPQHEIKQISWTQESRKKRLDKIRCSTNSDFMWNLFAWTDDQIQWELTLQTRRSSYGIGEDPDLYIGATF